MIVAYTGTHCTGKSTSVFEKARELKIKYPTHTVGILIENAKFSPFKLNKETTQNSQMWIYSSQIKSELELYKQYTSAVFDRTCIDPISYSLVNNLNDLGESMYNLAKHHIDIYDEIYFKTISKNDYALVNDGVRDGNDRKFRQDVEDTLLKLYERLISEGYLDKSKFFLI